MKTFVLYRSDLEEPQGLLWEQLFFGDDLGAERARAALGLGKRTPSPTETPQPGNSQGKRECWRHPPGDGTLRISGNVGEAKDTSTRRAS